MPGDGVGAAVAGEGRVGVVARSLREIVDGMKGLGGKFSHLNLSSSRSGHRFRMPMRTDHGRSIRNSTIVMCWHLLTLFGIGYSLVIG